MNKIIDLRSDTVTRPGPQMLDSMMQAKVGDDVFGDDPTVIRLQQEAAAMFGKEAALFCPSGTMANQIAMKAHTNPGDEVICDEGSHVYRYEGGGLAFNSGCSVRLLNGNRGRINADQVLEDLNPDNEHFPVSRLVVAENTSNRGGGSYYDFEELIKIRKVCNEHDLLFHLDGARLFNALAETPESPADYGKIFDSISICLSKGLGAPVGSLLLGSKDFMYKAHRIRKVFGGGMRQAGFLAAAGLYALKNNSDRLAEDHQRARELASFVEKLPFVESILPVDTNIVVIHLNDKIHAEELLLKLEEKGIQAIGFGKQTIRMVTHLDFTSEMLDRTKEIISREF